MLKSYDTIIIGAGPAGIFAARNLDGKGKVLLIEKGSVDSKCPIITSCQRCRACSNICGIGGAGGKSDGKLAFGKAGMASELYGDEYDKEMMWALSALLDNSKWEKDFVSGAREIEKGKECSQEAV